MSRCRISEEDAADPYFDGGDEDGYDVQYDPLMNGTEAERERFEDVVGSIDLLICRLYRDIHFKPDEGAFDAAWKLYDELKQHEKKRK